MYVWCTCNCLLVAFMQNDMSALDNAMPDLGTHTDFSFESQEHTANWFDTDL